MTRTIRASIEQRAQPIAMLTSSITPRYQSPDAFGFPPSTRDEPLEMAPARPLTDQDAPSTVSLIRDEVFQHVMACQRPSATFGPASIETPPLDPSNLQEARPEPMISIL